MGGCCCSAKNTHLHGATTYYYYPPTLEEHDSFASRDGPIPTITSGLLVSLNLEAPIPNDSQAPPAPLACDVLLGSQSTENDSAIGRGCGFETLGGGRDPSKTDCKSQSVSLVILPKKLGELSGSDEVDLSAAADEEDDCPICLEEYDQENPRLVTRCKHHFHFSCILEWMERSDICPICDKVLVLDHSFD